MGGLPGFVGRDLEGGREGEGEEDWKRQFHTSMGVAKDALGQGPLEDGRVGLGGRAQVRLGSGELKETLQAGG